MLSTTFESADTGLLCLSLSMINNFHGLSPLLLHSSSGHPDLCCLEAERFPTSPCHWLRHQPGLCPFPPPDGREAPPPPIQLPWLDRWRARRLQWYADLTKNKGQFAPVYELALTIIDLSLFSASPSARVEWCERCWRFPPGSQPKDGC